mmetsp:Transcript_61895/g.52438  ORF Transcript_61895/g.52438 Transcript_61895/m.52438 type:complete len:82 (+) Transcript_61895:183-428(+)
MRHKFVDFKGKMILKIIRDEFIKKSKDNDWAGVFTEYSQLIKQYIGDTNYDKLMPKFSTTSHVEQAIFETSLMHSMRHYFS